MLLMLVAYHRIFGRHNIMDGFNGRSAYMRCWSHERAIANNGLCFWTSTNSLGIIFFGIHILVMLFPCGLLLPKATGGRKKFSVIFAITALYFSASMVRLIMLWHRLHVSLVAWLFQRSLTKQSVMTQGRVASRSLRRQYRLANCHRLQKQRNIVKSKVDKSYGIKKKQVFLFACVTSLMVFFVWHCIWVAYVQFQPISDHVGEKRWFTSIWRLSKLWLVA